MADNVDFTPGTGATGATDDIGGVHYPRVKLSLGADGTAVDAVAGAGVVGTGVQRVTLANDDVGVALLTTIDADTGAIKTATELIDDAIFIDDADWVDGTSKHMNVGGVYQSSEQTVTDGDVAPISLDVNGRVKTLDKTLAEVAYTDDADWTDGSSKHLLTGALYQTSPQSITDGDTGPLQCDVNGNLKVNIGKLEDAAHSSGDAGAAILAVRRDAKSAGSGADGDYSTVNVNAVGDLRVDAGQAFVIAVAPTVTAGAYTAADVMGGEQTLTAAARASGAGGTLKAIHCIIEDDAGTNAWDASDIEVMIFNSDPAGTYTDNAALNGSALTDADAALLLAHVTLDTKVKLGDITMLKATGLDIPYVCSGSANLFAVAINRAGTTPAATDAMTFKYHLKRD